VALGPETSEFMLLTIAPFVAKIRISRKYMSEYPGPILTYITGLVGVLVGMIFQIFVWRLPKGCCCGNQLNLGDVRKRRMERPLLFALAFDNRLTDYKSAIMLGVDTTGYMLGFAVLF